jgi:tetratricopeptide (TPR) repeat protein
MRKIVIYGILVISVVSLALMGFQCSSAEMTSAKLYIQRKEYDNAEAQLRKELAKNPKNEEAYYLLGKEIYYPQKKFKEMADALRQALEIAPTHKKEVDLFLLQSWATTFNAGVDTLNNSVNPEDFNGAIEEFKLAAYLEPDSMANQQNLGLAYYRKGEVDSAIGPLTKAIDNGNSLVAIKILSGIYMNKASEYKTKFTDENQETIETKKNLDQIHEKMKAADVKYFIGQPESINQEKKGKGKKAVVVKEMWSYPKYKLVVTVQDEVVTGVTYTTPYAVPIDSSNYILAEKEFDKVIVLLKKASITYPEDSDISEILMNAYVGANRNDELRELVITRVKKYPDSKIDHFDYGVFLLKDNDYEKAIEEFKAALDIDPTYSSATYNLAVTYVKWGAAEQERLKQAGKDDDKSYMQKFKDALPYLESSLEVNPNDIQSWELAGELYAKLGNEKKATDAYDKADAIRQGKK